MSVSQSRNPPRSAPWVVGEYSHLPPLDALSQEMNDFMKYMASCERLQAVRDSVIDVYRNIAQGSLNGEVDVACFGSSATGLCLPTADLDLVIIGNERMKDGEGTTDVKQTEEDRQKAIKQLRRVLRHIRNGRGLATKTFLVRAKGMPIIKFIDVPTGLSVDISYSPFNLPSADGVAHLEYVKTSVQDERIRAIVIFLKYLLYENKLDSPSSGGLGGFATLCWVDAFVKAWDKSTSDPLPSETEVGKKDAGSSLMQFLKLYATHSDETPAIDVPAVKFTAKSLTVLDPVMPQNNVAKAFNQHAKLQALFQSTYNKLARFVYESPRNKHTGVPDDGILRHVVQLHKADLDHRSRLERMGANLLRNPRSRPISLSGQSRKSGNTMKFQTSKNKRDNSSNVAQRKAERPSANFKRSTKSVTTDDLRGRLNPGPPQSSKRRDREEHDSSNKKRKHK
ncbi:hypothetical protein SpCBS45565_g03191 [Spizellomyces sp. 'palustris']|nr:hypothetical protein SpCBS45565_g03191 [Spizellomyces sp. 'palustris']